MEGSAEADELRHGGAGLQCVRDRKLVPVPITVKVRVRVRLRLRITVRNLVHVPPLKPPSGVKVLRGAAARVACSLSYEHSLGLSRCARRDGGLGLDRRGPVPGLGLGLGLGSGLGLEWFRLGLFVVRFLGLSREFARAGSFPARS